MSSGRTNCVINLGKEEQTKSITITSNGVTTITPDEGKVLSSVKVIAIVSTTTVASLLNATKSCYYLFNGYEGNSIDNLIKTTDTKNVTNMSYMFSGCISLSTIPTLTTSSVPDMSYMFNNCKELTSIPLINTSSVTDMSYMFNLCVGLTTIPLLVTAKVSNMSNMFGDCESLISIPLIDTSEVVDMSYMFGGCGSLTTVPLLVTTRTTNMEGMFTRCRSLTSIPALDVSNTTKLDHIFRYCSALEEIHMTGMKVSFDISASTKFTQAALVEILNNLATVTTAQTLTMGATNLAKLTDADKKIATDKGWTLA